MQTLSDETPRASRSPAPASAVRGGAVLGVAAGASIALNYAFLLAAGRILGSEDYGELAALLGLLTVVLLPSGALQMAVSREVSRLEVGGSPGGSADFTRALGVASLVATLPIVALFYVVMVPLQDVIGIDSTLAIALAGVALVATFLYPTTLGVLQGHQRFVALAVSSLLPFAVRLGALAVLAGLGAALGGAVGAIVVSSIAGLGVAAALARRHVHGRSTGERPSLRPFLRYLGPVVVGLLGMSFLTNADIVLVKARFAADEAGVFAAASAFARVAYFLPSTLLAVLFPRTAARQARGQATDDILGRSLLVTMAFCTVLVLAYATIGGRVVELAFGAEFADAGSLLALFAVEMTLFSVANVLVGFHLSQADARFAWVVAAAVPVQLLVLATLPTSLREVIVVNACIGAALLVVHEAFIASSIPALRAGTRHLLRAR